MCSFAGQGTRLQGLLIALAVLTLTGITTQGDEISGFIEPYRDVDIAAGEVGRLVAIAVQEGERVTAGQIVARLDDDVLKAAVEVARANQESAGRIEAAEAEHRLNKEACEKLEELLNRGHATQRELDRAQAQLDMATARLKAAHQELKVKTLELERVRKQLEQRYIVSPIDGVVTQRYKDEGEFVSPNEPAVVRVVQLDPLLVVFSVPVVQARHLSAKQSVRVRIESIAWPLEGVIEFVSPTADAQSGTMRVRVRVPNPDEAIPSGLTCHLLLSTDAGSVSQRTAP